MQNVKVQLASLRLLCFLAADELKLKLPLHTLPIFLDKSLPEEEQHRLLMRLYTTYGPKSMNRENPTPGDLVLCYYEYHAALLMALAIEKARHWGDFS